MPRFGMRRTGRLSRTRATVPLIVALTASLLAVPAAQAAPAKPDFDRIWQPPKTPLPHTASISGIRAKKRDPVAPPHAVPKRATAAPAAPAVTALSGTALPTTAPARAGRLPVWVGPATKGPKAPLPAVTVVRNDSKAARAAGVHGLLFSVAAVDAATSRDAHGTVPVKVGLDLAELQRATGGQFAARGRLVALPACAATTPEVASCRVRTPLAARYDKATGRLTADLAVPAVAPAPARVTGDADRSPLLTSASGASAPSSAPMLLAAETGSSGGGGDYKASGLNPSSAWAAGGSSGALTYSYPFQLPPALGGQAPSLALGYDSSSVDGRTSATNAQASWIGDGWDLNPGFIERTYKPCDKAGITGSGDLCWAGFNASLSLGGHSGPLVRVATGAAGTDAATGVWRLKNDDGTKIEFGSGAANGVQDGAYAKVTDPAGTVYYFGVNHLPGGDKSDPATNSVSGVPVYSPKSGAPCYDAAKGNASWCTMWQRLQLDYVVDAHGNLTTYTWAPETNYYSRGGGQNPGAGTLTAYTRANTLASVAYGQRLSDQVAAKGGLQPAVRVTLGTAERCVETAVCDPSQRTEANKNNWPDVPVDQECKSSGTCTVLAPTFFTTRRLASVLTQVRVNNAWQDVDSYVLKHSFPDPKDATSQKALWLDSVQRTGKTGSPEIALPAVTFVPVMLANRVDGTDLVPAPPLMDRPRIQQIKNETGGVLNVDYNLPACSRLNHVMPPAEDDNTMACYPVRWTPPGSVVGSDPVLDWFNHFTVASLTENDTTTDAPQKITGYAYGPAGWHRDDSEFTEAKSRTWGEFRGFATVTATTGSGNDGPKSQVRTTYRQGMNGDVRKDGATRSVQLTDALGRSVTDHDWLSGQTLQNETYDQAGGSVVSRSVTGASGEVTTATHVRGSGLPDLVARYNATTTTVTAEGKKADGNWRSTVTTTTTDPAHNNRAVTTLEQAEGLPDLCSRLGYAAGPDPQVTGLVSEKLVVSGTDACTVGATAANTVARTRTSYDNLPNGQAAATGDATKQEILDRYETDGTPFFVPTAITAYDAYGRTVSVKDPNSKDTQHPVGAVTTTTYTPAATGELPSTLTVAAPVPGATSTWDSVTTMDVRRNLPLTVKDQNLKTTTETYDALGRLTGVWLPGRTPAANPNANMTFAYGVSNQSGVPSTTTTNKLMKDGETPVYVKSVDILDGFARTRQTQTSPANPAYTGRLVSDTLLDSQGRTRTANAPWYNDVSGPTGTLLPSAESTIPSQTRTTYDGQGHAVVTASWSLGVEQSRTTTDYKGVDRTDVVPPKGSAPTTTVADGRGHTSELWQYTTPTATGLSADATITRYTYTVDGNPLTRKDPVGNTWSYGYDQRGRQITATDPDTGTTTQTWDTAGRLGSTTNGKSQTVTFTYDLIGRKAGMFDGTATTTDKQLAAWTFDTATAGKGKPASSTRYIGGTGGQAYTTRIKGYDDGYRATGSTITIPGTDAGLTSGTFSYTTSTVYDKITGSPKEAVLPALGGVPMDDIVYSYNDYGQMFKYAGATTYDTQTEYDAFGRPIRSTVNPWATQVVSTTDYDQATGRVKQQFIDKQTSTTGAVQQTGYTYNDSGQITSITGIADNTPSQTDRQCFTYDALGRLTTAWTDTGGLTAPKTGQTQDQGGCATATPTPATIGGPAPYWQDYGYDLTGNRTRQVSHDPAGDTTKDVTTTQTFNAPGTVNTKTTVPTTGGGTGGPHALLTSTAKTATTTNNDNFQYDAVGNTTSFRAGKAGTSSLNWNSEGKLASLATATQIKGIGGKCMDMQGGSTSNGNPVQIYTCDTGAGQRFATAGDRLSTGNKCLQAMGTVAGSPVQIQPCDGTAAQTWTARPDTTFYNPTSGRCLAVPGDVTTDGTDLVLGDCATTVPAGQKWTVPDTTTTYVYDADGNQLVRRTPGKTTISLGTDELTVDTASANKTQTGTRYYPIPGGMTIVRTGAGTATGAFVVQIADHHGTDGLSIDLSTLTATRRATDPFGNARGTQPSAWAGDKGFVGGTKDTTTGLTNLGARQYLPIAGRFVSTDPLFDSADPQSWNGYAYADNNPVTNSDPDGRQCVHGAPGGGPDGKCAGAPGDTDGVIGDYSNNCVWDYCAADAQELEEYADKAGYWNRSRGERSPGNEHMSQAKKDWNAARKAERVARERAAARLLGAQRWQTAEAYMYAEIMRNLKSGAFKSMYNGLHEDGGNPLGGSTGWIIATGIWVDKVRAGADWDHKPKLKSMMHLRTEPDFYFKVPGTDDEDYYDVWSNVHYGFVGAAAGFDQKYLEDGATAAFPGAKILVGDTDTGDRVSVRQGIEMFKKYGTSMTQEQFHQGVLDTVAAMKQAGAGQVRSATG
ncbi:ricin-type beta-trefoil lectin domain protein [Streptomyces sp. NPDC048411]|uniref:ricin-type beta-trefoil lectin domain protein n=1 Tax=Streptomyces sp. NPDC048411 TaxID=3157206 RepID=UPI003457205B